MKIKDLAKSERPRERLLRNGAQSLSESELLAIILRIGIKGKTVIELAQEIIDKLGTFRNMVHTDDRIWKEFKGLGNAKLAQLKAALEIARRFDAQPVKKRDKFIDTPDIVRRYKKEMISQKNETVKIILCDAKNSILDTINIAQGSPTESYPIIREIISKS